MKKWLWVTLIALVSVCLVLPSGAQEGFATNTPSSNPFATQTATPTLSPTQIPPTSSFNAFATSTPIGFVPSPTPLPSIAPELPAASIAFYSLPTWFEADMISLLLRQVQNLSFAGANETLAVQLTQYELSKRYPDAPTHPADLEALVQAMLQAPIGSVDMRAFVRRYVIAELNRQPDLLQTTVQGFRADITPAKLNADDVLDAVIQLTYPAEPSPENPLRYADTLLTTRDALGRYTVLPTEYVIPAFPFTKINSVTLTGITDVNKDGLDDVLFVVDDGQASQRWVIVGVRNETAVDLTTPNQEIRVGKVDEWNLEASGADAPVLSILQYRDESVAPNWACVSQLPVKWKYENNFYRPSVALNTDFEFQDTLACTLYEAEPLFAKEPTDAIAIVEQVLQSYPFDSPSADRAFITLAMLYALDGRLDNAKATAESALATYGTDSWAGQQAQALIMAIADPNNSTLDICSALVQASPQGACDMNGLLQRFFSIIDLRTDQDLATQLGQYGFPVVEVRESAEVGKATRTLVRFNLVGADVFGFVAGRDGRYTAERTFSLITPSLSTQLVEAPIAAISTLLNDDNPNAVITLIDTFEKNLNGVPLSPVSQYIRALSYDLTGKRDQARTAYYDLWQNYGTTIWGQLAGEHLELRQ